MVRPSCPPFLVRSVDHLDILDRADALERVCGNVALLRELAELFLEDSPAALAAIRRALRTGDATTLRQAAHTLRGSAASMGSRLAQDAASQLEAAARAGDLTVAAERFRELEQTLEALWAALTELVEGKGPVFSDPTPLPWRRPPTQEPAL